MSTYTRKDLIEMQNWPLDRKIQVTQTRILEWYQHYEGKVFISFSGGKDSTVLADLAAKVCKAHGYKLVLWFSNTGLEYPEIVKHVKQFASELKIKYEIPVELVIDFPKDRKGKRITFKDVILKHGYPIISKEVAKAVKEARAAIEQGTTETSVSYQQLCGTFKNPNTGKKSAYNKRRWKFLIDAPFKISHWCCYVFKKAPSYRFEKETGFKPIIGTMAVESQTRRNLYLKEGCNAFEGAHPASKPLSFWTEQDIFEYLVKYEVPIASIYGDIVKDEEGKYTTTNLTRTGCVFCAFGCHLEDEPNRFQRLKKTHPKLWEYCMKPVDGGGLGMKEVLDYLHIKTE